MTNQNYDDQVSYLVQESKPLLKLITILTMAISPGQFALLTNEIFLFVSELGMSKAFCSVKHPRRQSEVAEVARQTWPGWNQPRKRPPLKKNNF